MQNLKEKLKDIYKPKKIYVGSWDLNVDDLSKMSLTKNDKNLFEQFLNRYYYMALNVIFKNDQLVNEFKCSIISNLVNNKRSLYFSKKTFLRNFIANIDDMLEINGEEVYTNIKTEIRKKKDMYRDVEKLGEQSQYYRIIKNEHKMINSEMPFEDFILICKKKFTRLLSGYNAVMEFFDKELDIDKFMDCFNINQLYLYTMTEILELNESNFDLYGRVNYSIFYLEQYEKLIETIREKEPFYNSLLAIDDVIWTIDDLLKGYHIFVKQINN